MKIKQWCRAIALFLAMVTGMLHSMERDESLPPKKRRRRDECSRRVEAFFNSVREGTIAPDHITDYVVSGGAINDTGEIGEQCIHVAAISGQQDVLQFLLDNGADINAFDAVGRCPIHWAVAASQTGMVQFLLDNGADVRANDTLGKTLPICWAAWNRHMDTLQLLLNEVTNTRSLSTIIQQPVTFSYAISHMPSLLLLLSHGALLPTFSHKVYEWVKKVLNEEYDDCSSLPSIELNGQTYQLSLSMQLRLAAGQGATEFVQRICGLHRERLELDDYVAALVGAAAGGHCDVVQCIETYMDNDVRLRLALPVTLSRALTSACAQRRCNVIDHLMRWQTSIVPLSSAGCLLRQLLRPFSGDEITESLRLCEHRQLFDLIVDTQRALTAFCHPDLLPITSDRALPIRALDPHAPVLPRELLMSVLWFFIERQLHQIGIGRIKD